MSSRRREGVSGEPDDKGRAGEVALPCDEERRGLKGSVQTQVKEGGCKAETAVIWEWGGIKVSGLLRCGYHMSPRTECSTPEI
ncbi:hypothetical protein NDU88_000972 [Pleurodeles waltl]|uniref:Uncharacterized protein n=1 Tax=Pleurodeles waltl TaxID=8319 RepID=A0AAV7KN91_PLEWA|nr:hypothetical protein NDU88_000972 [Pleurodeles waltl]